MQDLVARIGNQLGTELGVIAAVVLTLFMIVYRNGGLRPRRSGAILGKRNYEKHLLAGGTILRRAPERHHITVGTRMPRL
jgi:hypothetical protein